MLASMPLSMLPRVLSSDGRVSMQWRLPTVFVALPCGIYTEFVQQIIQDVTVAFFTAVPLSGRRLVHSFIVGQSPLLASYVRN